MTEQGKKNVALGVFAAFMVVLVWTSWVSGRKPLPTAEDSDKKLARDEYNFCVKQSNDSSRSPTARAQIAGDCLAQRNQFEIRFREQI